MKKDYIAVSQEDSATDESQFVEDFWTRRWDKLQLHPDVEFVSRTEEYRLMKPILDGMDPGSKILDGGCGIGAWTSFLSHQGFTVVGLDISEQTVERLREFIPNHKFIRGDIRGTEFQDSSFDAYFSWGTFEHFEEGLGKCFQEAHRILKPGGHLFVSVPFQNRRHLRRDRRDLSTWDSHFDKHHGYSSTMRFYQWRLTEPELVREFEMNGFKVLNVTPIHKDQGIYRAVTSDLHIDLQSPIHRIMRFLLYPFVPKQYVAHMIMGIGRKK